MPDTPSPLLRSGGPVHLLRHQPALFGVSFKVPSRGGVAILGRNGAGKTTAAENAVRRLKPARGSIRFRQVDTTRLRTEQRVRRGIGYVRRKHAYSPKLTVRENLLVGAMATSTASRASTKCWRCFPSSANACRSRPAHFPGGERKMLAIGRALLARPYLLHGWTSRPKASWHGVIDEIAERLDSWPGKIAIVIVEQAPETGWAFRSIVTSWIGAASHFAANRTGSRRSELSVCSHHDQTGIFVQQPQEKSIMVGEQTDQSGSSRILSDSPRKVHRRSRDPLTLTHSCENSAQRQIRCCHHDERCYLLAQLGTTPRSAISSMACQTP